MQTFGKQTFQREIVKSVEECKIANFLFFNNVEYQYEFPYEHQVADKKHSQWKPDFTITQNDKRIYLEHFGVNRSNNISPKFVHSDTGETYEMAKRKYLDKMEWARESMFTRITIKDNYDICLKTLGLMYA